MKLSIIMMVKNEEKNLLRTLPSLTTLRENIDSELIIMDTGSSDKSVEIAKSFTDKVYEVKWDNDFASMRNKLISFAKGEWILILDADEEVVNFDNLLDFFETKKDEKYNSCAVELKNFLTEDLERFEFVTLPRIFRNKDLKYIGAVHEQPNFKLPIYSTETGVLEINHYGYMFEDMEFRHRKMKRNEEILLKELRANPNDGYVNYQLGINFMILENPKKAEKFFLKALKEYENKNILYYPIYAGLINTYMYMKEEKKCKNLCLKYLKKDKFNLDIFYWLGMISKLENNLEDSVKYYEKYLYFSKNYHQTTQAKDISCSSKTKGREKEVLISLIDSYSKFKNYKEVVRVCKELEGIEKNAVLSVYNQLVKALYFTQNLEEIALRYKNLNTLSSKNSYIDAIELTLKEVDKKEDLYNLFTDIDDNYSSFIKMKISETVDINKAKIIFEEETSNVYSYLLKMALDKNIDIKEMLTGLSYPRVRGLINSLVENNKESIIKLYKYVSNLKVTFNPYSLMVDVIICEVLLKTNFISKDKKENLFNLYIFLRYTYLKITRNGLKNSDISLLSSDVEDIFISKLKCIEEIDKSDIIKIVKSYKNLGEIFNDYLDFIIIRIDKEKFEFEMSSEFKLLKAQFIEMIKNALNSNDLNTVKALLAEFELVDKNINFEIESIKSIIALNEGDMDSSFNHIKKSLIENNDNFDVIYNLGYLYLLENNISESLYCFEYIISNAKDLNILNDAINFVETNLK